MDKIESGIVPRRVFRFVVAFPKTVILMGAIIISVACVFLPRLVTDTRPNSFLQPDNPALVYRELVKEQFGLSDPLVIAVVDEGPQGIFAPSTLSLVQWLSDEVSVLPNIEESRVFSLATEKNITGTDEGMDIQPFFDPVPATQEEADRLRAAINDFPLYLGSLVAKDGQATLIVVELIDELQVEASYQRIMSLVSNAPNSNESVQIHVAGEGAIAGYMGAYIESDARVLIPLAVLTITLIIVLAFRRLSSALVTNVIVFATILVSIGIMAGNGTPFFAITNALPVILIGIAVADAIHIYSHFFDLRSEQPEGDSESVIVQTMMEMVRPVTLTSLTTMAGFLGLYLAAAMPPLKYFGLYAALGVFIAWAYSMTVLPALIRLTNPAPGLPVADSRPAKAVLSRRFMAGVGKISIGYPRVIVTVFAIVALSGVYAASHILIDEDPVDIFHPSEPLYQADKIINRHMDGTNALDIVIKTSREGGLFELSHLRKIEALQDHVEALPHVGGSTSIVDYLKQMNRAMNGGAVEAYRLPDSEELAAQYFLLYSATSDPTDFEEEIDYGYQTANIRVNLDTNRYQNYKAVVEDLQRYIEDEFNSQSIEAVLSGRLNLNYHWIRDLGYSHFAGLLVALLLVWAVSALLFGSVLAGVYTLIPVCAAVLFVYAAMVLLGMHVGVGTSMFAAVAVGLGVDYSIHVLSRLRALFEGFGAENTKQAFDQFYLTTGRALLFNFLAIACGFGVLITSKISSLFNFGSIVVLAVAGSFVASMTLLPALIKLFRPGFMFSTQTGTKVNSGTLTLIAVLIVGVSCLLPPSLVAADEHLVADDIVKLVNEVDDGEFVSRTLTMRMVDRRGNERVREAVNYRKYLEAEKRTALFFSEPANIKGTAFLIYDYFEGSQEDDQWLYLPAMRKVRRISAADRGDYFFGTDFTYEDMKLDGKLDPKDYNFSILGKDSIEEAAIYRLEAVARSEEIAKELGYSRTELWIDDSMGMIIKADFYDLKNQPLKTLEVSDIRQVNDIWTRHQLRMNNHKTGHQTYFTFTNVDYAAPVDDDIFSTRSLARGR
jgi:uncharacterized protein